MHWVCDTVMPSCVYSLHSQIKSKMFQEQVWYTKTKYIWKVEIPGALSSWGRLVEFSRASHSVQESPMFIAPLFVQVSSLLFHNFCNPQVQSLDNHNICKPKLQTGLATQQLCGHCKKLAWIKIQVCRTFLLSAHHKLNSQSTYWKFLLPCLAR
jgi:hypothetical protein